MLSATENAETTPALGTKPGNWNLQVKPFSLSNRGTSDFVIVAVQLLSHV